MSKRARALILAAMVAAMNLAAMTTLAHARTNDQPARPPTQGQVGESWHPRAKVPVQPVEPSGQPSWLIPAIGVLAALALCGGLAVTTTRRTRRRVRVGHAA